MLLFHLFSRKKFDIHRKSENDKITSKNFNNCCIKYQSNSHIMLHKKSFNERLVIYRHRRTMIWFPNFNDFSQKCLSRLCSHYMEKLA